MWRLPTKLSQINLHTVKNKYAELLSMSRFPLDTTITAFCLIAILFGLFYAFNVPIGYDNDEGAHILKAGSQDGAYNLKIPIAGYQGIGRFVMGLPGEVEVSGSSGFKKYLKEELKKFGN